jgi:hypothetical protein
MMDKSYSAHHLKTKEEPMSELSNLPVELTDHELDQVAAGQLPLLNVVLFDPSISVM